MGQRKPCPPGGARSIVRGAAVRRRLRTFEHSIVPHDRGNAQPIVLEYAATALRLDGAMDLQIAPRVRSSSSRQNDGASSLPESDTLRKRSIEMKPSNFSRSEPSAAPMSRYCCALSGAGHDSKMTAIMCGVLSCAVSFRASHGHAIARLAPDTSQFRNALTSRRVSSPGAPTTQ